ncbi:MAG: glycogen/starch synthase, partial [Pirellulales bacterium]|nr:glycogen/starch synthase [Pirellulales bacterium]
MQVLFASSEVAPFAKTGGLADVSRDLPLALSRLGSEVAIVMPAYRSVWQAGCDIQETGIRFELPIGSKIVKGSLLKSHLPQSQVPVYLVQQDYYDRSELYQRDGEDYRDNCERFVFFCRAVMETPGQLGINVDVLHANDWQTGLLPAYLKTEFAGVPSWE